jgi:hypothetical protein
MPHPDRRRPLGRPPLSRNDPSAAVLVRMPSKQYDALFLQAARERVSVPDLVRRVLNHALGNNGRKR